MKKLLPIILITTLLISCKKSSTTSNQIGVVAYVESSNGFIDVDAYLYSTSKHAPFVVQDTVTVVVLAPLPSGTEIDTIYVTPYFSEGIHDAAIGTVTGQTPCTILSVTSKGGYSFSY